MALHHNPGIFSGGFTRRHFIQISSLAARQYYNGLKVVRQGDNARYACKRLADWGYIK